MMYKFLMMNKKTETNDSVHSQVLPGATKAMGWEAVKSMYGAIAFYVRSRTGEDLPITKTNSPASWVLV